MKRIRRRMALGSELPEDALRDCARITLVGRSVVLIEGQHGVVEMGKTCIRLVTNDGLLSVRGEQLKLSEMSMDAARVEGNWVETVTDAERSL